MKYKYVKMVEQNDTEEHIYFRIFESDEEKRSNAKTSKHRFPISVVENMIAENDFSSLNVWLEDFNLLPSKFNFGNDLRNLFAENLNWDSIPTEWFEV